MGVCAFVGDCIALGLAMAHPGCETHAKMGRAPAAILQHVPFDHYGWAVISAGSNPAGVLPSPAKLRAIRARVSAGEVVWVLPASSRRAAIVRRVAQEHGDRTVPIVVTARDRVHPRSYAALWRAVARALEVRT